MAEPAGRAAADKASAVFRAIVKGRVVNQPDFTTSVCYTLNFTKDGKTTSITLSTMVPGIYETTK